MKTRSFFLIMLLFSLQCTSTKALRQEPTIPPEKRGFRCDHREPNPGPFPNFASVATESLLTSEQKSLMDGTCIGTQNAFPEGVSSDISVTEIESACLETEPSNCIHQCVAMAKAESAYLIYYQIMDGIRNLEVLTRSKVKGCSQSLEPRVYWKCIGLSPLPEKVELRFNDFSEGYPQKLDFFGDLLPGYFIHIIAEKSSHGCGLSRLTGRLEFNYVRQPANISENNKTKNECANLSCRIQNGRYRKVNESNPK